jgi:hypothetical protein
VIQHVPVSTLAENISHGLVNSGLMLLAYSLVYTLPIQLIICRRNNDSKHSRLPSNFVTSNSHELFKLAIPCHINTSIKGGGVQNQNWSRAVLQLLTVPPDLG